jgi:dihydroxy-acid dehydratase
MTLRILAANTSSRRANWRALGLSQEDMQKPKIAVVNLLAYDAKNAVCVTHKAHPCST